MKKNISRNILLVLFLILSPLLSYGQDTIGTGHKPRVMVIIPEYHIERKISGSVAESIKRQVPDPAGETEIIKKFTEKGFKSIDQHHVSGIRFNDQVAAAVKGDISRAVKIGAQFGAEVVIVGEAFSETTGHVIVGMTSCKARIEARVIKTDTGEIMAADSRYATALDVSEAIAGKKAIQKAANELADHLIAVVLEKWSSNGADKADVELVVEGLDYRQFIRFKIFLQQSFGSITAVQQRSFSGGRGIITVYLNGTAQSLSEEMALKNFKEFQINVLDYSANKLTLQVDGQ